MKTLVKLHWFKSKSRRRKKDLSIGVMWANENNFCLYEISMVYAIEAYQWKKFSLERF